MKRALSLASAALLLATIGRAQTVLGPRFGPVPEAPAPIDAETLQQIQSITDGLMASFDAKPEAPGLAEAFEALHAEALSEGVSAPQQAARLVLGVATRRVDERSLQKQRVPSPLVMRLSVLYVRARTAARNQPVFAAVLDRIRVDRPALAAAPVEPILVVQRLKAGVFEVNWGERTGILKVIAEPDEGIVQRKAREVLLRAGIQGVGVPEVFGDWDILSAPKLPPEVLAERKANRRVLWMATAPGVRLHEIKTQALPEPVSPRALANVRQAIGLLHAENITHNDLDPLNLLIHQEAGRTQAHIIDWEFGSTRSTPRQKKLDLVKLDQALSILDFKGFNSDGEGGGRLFSIAPFIPLSALAEFSSRTIGGVPLPVLAAAAAAGALLLLMLSGRARLLRRFFPN